MDPVQIAQNITLEQALRRAALLAAAAEVSQAVTQILDIDTLLPKTVDIICDAYGFYYAGIFLIDTAGEFAVLRAGRGEPGRIMIATNHKLAVGGNSMIGACTARNVARISLDVDTEQVWYPNPVLPDTRSEMALPLAVGERVLGALTVQSTAAAAFTEEDISSLQAMANQLAIALDNAHQRRALEQTHAQLVQAKTFEAIATATGDAIHWIGNKAEPIAATVQRLRSDVQVLGYSLAQLLKSAPDETRRQPLAQLLLQQADALAAAQPEIGAAAQKLAQLPPDRLAQTFGLTSMLEDLDIINTASTLIMKVKEELIGPAREQAPRPVMVEDVLQDAVAALNLTPGLVAFDRPPQLPLALADSAQLYRVFDNLLKNALEALEGHANPKIKLSIRLDAAGDYIRVDVADNGPGIPPAELDKIWVTFHTTKNVTHHAGLGLPACRLILEHIGGNISVDSRPPHGCTFTVALSVYQGPQSQNNLESGRGKILLIDDDDAWRHFAAGALENAGYKVTQTGQPLKSGHYAQYHLILLDDTMASADPRQILQTIIAANLIDKTLVITSAPRLERAKAHQRLGVRDLKPKPYTRADLLKLVRLALSANRYSPPR
jgi:signal transduction histidine kinase/CheY-like chemotaxis protein